MPNLKRYPTFSAFLYRYRNLPQLFFCKLEQFRAVATRYDKREEKLRRLSPIPVNPHLLTHNEAVAKAI